VPDDLPAYVDPRLWFEMDGCPSRHYLVDGNSTVLGRMYFYCPLRDLTTRVSKSEMTVCSEEAGYFVRGFLAGSEPGPPVDEDGILLDDDAAVEAWRGATIVWRRTGGWPRDVQLG
jgi:hypothetical protein